jgi:hypothetical protein
VRAHPINVPPRIDAIIDYDEAAGFLENPPSLEPRPNFTNIRALQKHIVQALAQLSCPQSAIHGWSGLAMDPATYLLLEGEAFTIPLDPGPKAIFLGGVAVAQTVMKTTQATFDRAKNYFLSYKNITRACFRMLDANVSAQFKVSKNLALTGWNSTMSIIDILSQLQVSYGKPNMMMLYTNDTLFRSPVPAGDSPEMLFYRIEQCQEIQHIGNLSYSNEQIIANTVRILLQANIFPLKEFDAWEAVTPKTYLALKTFIHGAYDHRLMVMALCSTSGQNRYANQTIYKVIEAGLDDDTDDNTVTTVMQTTALTTTAGNATPSGITAISAEVAAAINQLSANQLAIMSQMVAINAQMATLSVVPHQVQRTRAFALREQFHVPPIQQVAVPMQQPFLAIRAYLSGRGGQQAGRGCGRGGRRDGRSHTPFADAMRRAGTAQPIAAMVPYGGGITQPPTRVQQQQRSHPDFSNIYKVHNNWNVCFRCGFDIEDGHTSITCPFKRWNHQDLFTRKNSQQFIAAGYDPCTKGMHKTVLPSGRNT